MPLLVVKSSPVEAGLEVAESSSVEAWLEVAGLAEAE